MIPTSVVDEVPIGRVPRVGGDAPPSSISTSWLARPTRGNRLHSRAPTHTPHCTTIDDCKLQWHFTLTACSAIAALTDQKREPQYERART